MEGTVEMMEVRVLFGSNRVAKQGIVEKSARYYVSAQVLSPVLFFIYNYFFFRDTLTLI
jgi:hypothetical protein